MSALEQIDKYKYALRQCKGCEYWLDHDLECFCLFCNNCLKKGGVIKHRKGSAYPLCQKCFEKEQKNKLRKNG